MLHLSIKLSLSGFTLRKSNCYDQAVPNFSGWRQALRKVANQELQKAVETFLPPITSKLTDFTTISQYRTYLQSLAGSSNIPYVNITLDVGAAINSYKCIWSNFTDFENVVIILVISFHKRKVSDMKFYTVAILFKPD